MESWRGTSSEGGQQRGLDWNPGSPGSSSETLGDSNAPGSLSSATEQTPGRQDANAKSAYRAPCPPPHPQRRWEAFAHLPSSFDNFLKAPFRNQQEANPFIKLPPPFSCVATRLTYCYLKHFKNIWKRKQYKNDPETDSGLVILDHTLKNQERRVNCPLQGRGGSPLGHVTQHLSGSESDSSLWAQAV